MTAAAASGKEAKTKAKPVLEHAADFANLLARADSLISVIGAEAQKIQEAGDAVQYARAFVVLHHLRAKLDEFDKNYNKVYEVIKKERMPAMLEAVGMTNVPLAEGYRVGVSLNYRASIREGQKDAAHKWLREQGLGDLIQETVNASTLSAAAKALLEDETNPRELDDTIFNCAFMPTTSVTKTKPKE